MLAIAAGSRARAGARCTLRWLPTAGAVVLAGCGGRPAAPSVGDAERGSQRIAAVGCGSCHEIPGVSGAKGRVGPPLDDIGERTVIAGMIPNTPENMIRWLKTPQAIVPGNAMPDMDLSERDAEDIAAYLYTLR